MASAASSDADGGDLAGCPFCSSDDDDEEEEEEEAVDREVALRQAVEDAGPSLVWAGEDLRWVPDCLMRLAPVSIGTTLTLLDLSCNAIEEIPRSVSRLRALTTLNLASNKLTRLPSAVGACRRRDPRVRRVNVEGGETRERSIFIFGGATTTTAIRTAMASSLWLCVLSRRVVPCRCDHSARRLTRLTRPLVPGSTRPSLAPVPRRFAASPRGAQRRVQRHANAPARRVREPQPTSPRRGRQPDHKGALCGGPRALPHPPETRVLQHRDVAKGAQLLHAAGAR